MHCFQKWKVDEKSSDESLLSVIYLPLMSPFQLGVV
jgi:hypothetical protein